MGIINVDKMTFQTCGGKQGLMNCCSSLLALTEGELCLCLFIMAALEYVLLGACVALLECFLGPWYI